MRKIFPSRLMSEVRVLVTGGTGLVGKAIEWNAKNNPKYANAQFIFLSSSDADLRDLSQTKACFEKHRPTHVIHLAAIVVEMMVDNLAINNNVLRCANDLGVNRVVSMTSTCVFPDKIEYPITEDQIHDGPPHSSNEGYAYAKRMVEVLSRCYNEQYGRKYTTVIPTNVFGPHDNYSIQDGHVAPGLMHKCLLAKKNGTDLTIWGSGKPLRQFIFSRDLAALVVWATLEYEGCDSLMLSPDADDEISIADLAKMIASSMSFPLERLVFDTSKADGQFKKTVSNKRLRSLRPDFKFTPMEEAMRTSVQWFEENFETCRK